jgi:hypothetical protein
MAFYKKRPVVIEAFQLGATDPADWPEWFTAAIDSAVVGCAPGGSCTINTLEGEHTANPDDWIIKGIKGELYPCKSDIFKATYELVGR